MLRHSVRVWRVRKTQKVLECRRQCPFIASTQMVDVEIRWICSESKLGRTPPQSDKRHFFVRWISTGIGSARPINSSSTFLEADKRKKHNVGKLL